MNKKHFNLILSTLFAVSLIGGNGAGNIAPAINGQTNLNSEFQKAASIQMSGGHSFSEFNANKFNFYGSDFKLVFSDNTSGQTGCATLLLLMDTFGRESSLTTSSLYDSRNLTQIYPNLSYVTKLYDSTSMPTGGVAINEVDFDNIDASVAKYLVSAKDIQNDSNIVSVDILRNTDKNELGIIFN